MSPSPCPPVLSALALCFEVSRNPAKPHDISKKIIKTDQGKCFWSMRKWHYTVWNRILFLFFSIHYTTGKYLILDSGSCFFSKKWPQINVFPNPKTLIFSDFSEHEAIVIFLGFFIRGMLHTYASFYDFFFKLKYFRAFWQGLWWATRNTVL